MGTPFTQGTYRILLQDRETQQPIDGCDFTNAEDIIAQFGRIEHVFSEAFVQTSLRPEFDCTNCADPCSCIPNGRAAELAFYRDDWEEAAWIGPVQTIEQTATGEYLITAFDRLWWTQGSPTSRDFPTSLPVDQSILELLVEADRYQPSGLNYPATAVGCDVSTTLGLVAGDMIWPRLQLLDRLATWSTVGPQLYWGCPTVDRPPGEELRASVSWTEAEQGVSASRTFTNVATRVRVEGAEGAVVFWPVDGDAAPVDGQGKRTISIVDTNLTDLDDMLSIARVTFTASRTVGTAIESGEAGLSEAHDFGLQELIVGRVFPIAQDVGCLESADMSVLRRVVVDIARGVDDAGQGVLRELRVATDFSTSE